MMFSKSNDSTDRSFITPSSRSVDRLDVLVSEMAAGWRRGEEPTASDLLDAHPELDDEAAVRLIFEEVSLRRESGQDVDTVEVLARYPRWREELEPLLGFEKLLNHPSNPPTFDFPEAGDRIGEFQLLLELGRGASGRTFLASQASLADRPVVLKLMARDQSEHLSLARLQHTYIVPLYWEQEFSEFGIRGLLMPYLGGANLAVILDELAKIPVTEREGSDFNDALGRLMDPLAKESVSDEQRFQQFFGMATYDQAACWIAVCLAEALQYAHDRGLIHMDVKPSNVLIAADGQPMLLDFHLAREPIPAWSAVHDRLGGTPGWTSPEQEAAMHAAFEGKPIETPVDGRSDVYALGLLLYEVLGGTWDRVSRTHIPRLRRCNPTVSTGLSDIIHRALAPQPSDRYPTAAKLADDLRAHLQDLPLKGVSNRSLIELWRKWRRRVPYSAAQFLLLASILTIVAIGVVFFNERVKAASDWTAESRRLWKESNFEETLYAANQGLSLSRSTPFYHPNSKELEQLKSKADWATNAVALHVLADKIRFANGAVSDQRSEIRSLAPKLRKAWELHQRLEGSLDSTDEKLEELRGRLAIDFQEIAVVWARLRMEIDPKESALTDARRILIEAEEAFGTSLTLNRELRAINAQLGIASAPGAEAVLPESAWEHYEVGRLHLAAKRFEAAALEFEKSLDLDPTAFWTNFFDGYCAYQRGRYGDALAAFRVCVSREPRSAILRVNRGLTYEALGNFEEAYQEYTKVIELAPKLVEGHFNRGHIEVRRGHFVRSIEDLGHALECARESSSDEVIRARILFIRALAYRSLNDFEASRRDAQAAAALGSIEAKTFLESYKIRRSQ